MKKYIVIIFFLLCVCGMGVLTACRVPGGENAPTESGTAVADGILPADLIFPGPDETVCLGSHMWNDYIVTNAWNLVNTSSANILKYNFKTGTLTEACVDPLCSHGHGFNISADCPRGAVVGIRGNTMYYIEGASELSPTDDPAVRLMTVSQELKSYDLTDGTSRVLWTTSYSYRLVDGQAEDHTIPPSEVMSAMVLCGDYLIMTRFCPNCDVPTAEEDYDEWLVCMNADTGAVTRLINLTEKGIGINCIHFIRDGKMYYEDGHRNQCELDLAAQKTRVLLPYGEDGENANLDLWAGLIGDWLWYQVNLSETDGISIRRLNLNDGTVEIVVPATHGWPAADVFTICDGHIYVLRHEDTMNDGVLYDYTIVRYDMDGSNETEVGSLGAFLIVNLVPYGDKLFIRPYMAESSLVFDIPSGTFTSVEQYVDGIPASEEGLS